MVPVTSGEDTIRQLALQSPKVLKHTEGKEMKKSIVVPKKLVNIVCA
jgi:leucyl-tRNA synthetase